MKIAAGGVPGSGLGDAKRAASFLQPFDARDSCCEGADDDDDDDADDELYCYLSQQGDAEATNALHRVTPEKVYFDSYLVQIHRHFWVCWSNRSLKRRCQRSSPGRLTAAVIGQSLLLEKHTAKALFADSQTVKSPMRRKVLLPLSRL